MKPTRTVPTLGLLVCLAAPTLAQAPNDPLLQGFRNPPDSAKPRVWWHWMNGNVTKEGIRLDLEWMKRIGIGGFQNFDASLFTPPVVEKRLTYMTPEWKDAFRYATETADRLGLEMAIAGSPGWSESGGPWVKPEQAMKKLVWSETRVDGGKPFVGKLAAPPDATGPFQSIPIAEFSFGAAPATPKRYVDVRVLAYPTREASLAERGAKVTVSGGDPIDARLLDDGDLTRFVAVPRAPVGLWSSLQIAFPTPQVVHALTLSVQRPPNPLAQFLPPGPSGQTLEASDDGVTFRKVAEIPGGGLEQHTLAFPPVSARFFRIVFVTQPEGPNPLAALGLNLPPPPPEHRVTELSLHTAPRVHRFEEKAAFVATALDLAEMPTPWSGDGGAIHPRDVVDLTQKMAPDGTLTWTPPPGRWAILRLGHTLTGHKNAPASPEATGLEVDKLSQTAVRDYFTTYLDQYRDATGGLMGARGLRFVITDSWEAGVQNWTDDLLAEFTRRRGYAPTPFLPALTGKVVEGAAATDRFLWDFRRTLADLVAERHYNQLTDLLRARGMARYTESHESGRAFIGDGMEVKRTAAVPMSAMWTQQPGVDAEQHGYNADIRESASVAHLYGQNLVAAESLTANSGAWAWSPETLKPTADQELAMGLNRFVLHTSVHQPLVGKAPGLALGPFGQWFTRNETWAELATPWISYLARCSYLLQQGRFVADVLYFYGEDTNVTARYADGGPEVPAGYAFDFVNADALTHIVSVKDGQLATPSGMRYRVLAIDPRVKAISLPVLRRLKALADAGAVIVGPRPAGSPSRSDRPAEVERLIRALWDEGKVVDRSLDAALMSAGVAPDVVAPKAVRTVHRALKGVDLYFVVNRGAQPLDASPSFRIAGRDVALWHPDTGQTEPASYRSANGRTDVPLRLGPHESVFVVFRAPTRATVRTIAPPTVAPLASVDGPWTVRFQPDRGAPAQIALPSLASWSESADPGVRYFAGTGTYARTFVAPSVPAGTRVWLDLGDVKNFAQVTLNGRALGTLWKPPYRIDVTDALRQGENALEIAVTNLWVNRLIGDQQPGATQKFTFTTQAFYKADAPLLPSGLLGPVRLLKVDPR